MQRLLRQELAGTVLSLDDRVIGEGNPAILILVGANAMLAAKIALEQQPNPAALVVS